MTSTINIVIGTVIGFMTYALIYNMTDNMTNKLEFDEKVQKRFVLNFLFGLVLLVLAYTFFTTNKKLSNKMVRLGFIISGSCLLFNTIILNWDNLDESSRVCLICICLGIVMWYAYYIDSKNKNKNKINIKKRKKRYIIN
jgi:dipeptide/tripeptide permease